MILCGGRGTRIKDSLPPGIPKCMVDINGVPFLDLLLDYLAKAGFRRFILCTGFGRNIVRAAFGTAQEELDGNKLSLSGIFISLGIVEEDRQLGTAAAIVGAIPEIGSDPFFVVNGDTICEMDYGDFIRNHYLGIVEIAGNRRSAEVSAAITIEGEGTAVSIATNAGVWLCSKRLFPYLYIRSRLDIGGAVKELSKDLPTLTFHAQRFWDIGSPEGLEAFRGGW